MRHGQEIAGIPPQGAKRLGHRDFPGHETNVARARICTPT